MSLAIGDVPDLDDPLITEGLDSHKQEGSTEQNGVNLAADIQTAQHLQGPSMWWITPASPSSTKAPRVNTPLTNLAIHCAQVLDSSIERAGV